MLLNENPPLQVWEVLNGAGSVLWEQLLQPIGRNQVIKQNSSHMHTYEECTIIRVSVILPIVWKKLKPLKNLENQD